jgi:RNA polymerase sigma-70 factor (ECF subfamily)
MEPTLEELRALLDGEPRSIAVLVEALRPLLRSRIVRVTQRASRSLPGATNAPDVDDLCQEALLELFGADARTLRGWDPARGLTLPRFAQLIAERVAWARIRCWRRGLAASAPLDGVEEPPADSAEHPDRRVASRKRFERVLEALQYELSPRGVELFRALFVEGQHTAQVCREFALRPDAVYAWKSRLGKRIKAILRDIEPGSGLR